MKEQSMNRKKGRYSTSSGSGVKRTSKLYNQSHGLGLAFNEGGAGDDELEKKKQKYKVQEEIKEEEDEHENNKHGKKKGAKGGKSKKGADDDPDSS